MPKTLIPIVIILCTAVSCDNKPKLRTYAETTIMPTQVKNENPHGSMFMKPDRNMQSDDPNVQTMLNDSIAAVELEWDTPENWDEQKGSGMRLVTFTSREDSPVTCTIISLKGPSGGLKTNVMRWLNQVGMSALDDAQFKDFIQNQKVMTVAGGLNIQIVDLTQLQTSASSQDPSMIAGILQAEGKSIFIKMTGQKADILRNKDMFKQLCQSLRL